MKQLLSLPLKLINFNGEKNHKYVLKPSISTDLNFWMYDLVKKY